MSGQLPWSTVLDVDGPPIEAVPETFDDLADFFTTLSEDTSLVADSFARIVNDSNADFQGEAAEAFATMVGDLASTLALVPSTADTAAGFLRSHATELAALREEANAALGRANTRYHSVQTARDALASAEAGRNRLQNQLDNFDATICGDENHRMQAELDLDTASRGVTNARTNLSTAEDELVRSQTEYNNLRDDYDRLDNRTCTDLDHIALGDLSDPSWLEQAWNGISGFVVDVLSDIFVGAYELVAGALSGDWQRALFGLSDMLSGVLTVLSIASFAFPGLAAVVAVVAGLKLLVDLVIVTTTDNVNPRTGESITPMTFAMTALSFAGAQWGSSSGAFGRAGQGLGNTVDEIGRVAATTTSAASAGSGAVRVANVAASHGDDFIEVASRAGTVFDVGRGVHENATVSPYDTDVAAVAPTTPVRRQSEMLVGPDVGTDGPRQKLGSLVERPGYGVVVLVPVGEED